MTEREKLLETLKVAYEPRKIPQDDGSVALFYPTDEDVADMIEAAIIDEYKHRAEVAERALLNACRELSDDIEKLQRCLYKAYIAEASQQLAEQKTEGKDVSR